MTSYGKMRAHRFNARERELAWAQLLKEGGAAHGNRRELRGKRRRHLYAVDRHANVIYKHAYGTRGAMSWQMGHIVSLAAGGSNNVRRNVRPEHWRANLAHGRKHM
jgi:hypothetical protein